MKVKKQVIIIHGGNTFETYKDYLSYLKTSEVDLEKFKFQPDWKEYLSKRLGTEFEVLSPRMPNGTNADYTEWKIWFERIIPFIKNGIILIGHSLGGIFLAKFLSENNFPKKIKATILIAAPYCDKDSKESLFSFKLTKKLTKFSGQGGEIFLFQSKDDPVVDFNEVDKYRAVLPNSKPMIFNKKGHFRQATFPKLLKLIKSL